MIIDRDAAQTILNAIVFFVIGYLVGKYGDSDDEEDDDEDDDF